MHKNRRWYKYAAVLSLIVTPKVLAQDTSPLQSDLQRCAMLENSVVRLACFEALAHSETQSNTQLKQLQKQSEFNQAQKKVAPSSNIEAQKEAMGSERLKSQKALDSDSTTDGVIFIVIKLEKNGQGHYIFRMSNGQVWREIEPSNLQFPRQGNFNVRIKQGFLGSYKLRAVEKGRATRVTRVK
jgi:hypothetical protein